MPLQQVPRPSPPFPQRLKKIAEDGKFTKFITMLRQLSMPGYAKFMKDLVTKKRAISIDLTDNVHHCSAIATKSMVQKKEDPGELNFRLNKEEVKFNICWSIKQPHDMNVVSAIEVFNEEEMGTTIEERPVVETLVAVLMNLKLIFGLTM
ncbi:hypothetical protein R3W88_024596 [Solanum pinnatisectum]|uniref:Uncharacterized protein n=1 Tax=Solanum pinnatisectum TaxID=50273 RepID=A0AAV9M1I7_9SOLN|nr:hypothetical protein R3W88_024596 [Solanum pinnatisectum]